MIEINLLGRKGAFKLPTFGGVDLNQVNIKLVLISLITLLLPDWFLKDAWNDEIAQIQVQLKDLDEKVRDLDKDIQKNSTVKEQLDEFNKQVDKLKERSQQVDKIIKQKTNPKNLLERIARDTPKDLWLDKIVLTEDKKIQMDGRCNSYKSIGEFIIVSNESSYFGKSLTLVDTNTESEGEDKQKRIEVFKIEGKIESYDPFSGVN